MKTTYPRLAAVGAMGLSLCLAASALAQDHPGGPGGPPSGPRGGERQKMFKDMQHSRQQRLHDLLQIKADQETAFRAFVTGLEQTRPQRDGKPGQPGPRSEPRQAMTALERLDHAAQRLNEAQQRLQKTSAVVKTFYAALTPDQRKAFDTLPLAMGGEGMQGPGRRMMMMRGMRRGPEDRPPL
jgi:hypothetical protein